MGSSTSSSIDPTTQPEVRLLKDTLDSMRRTVSAQVSRGVRAFLRQDAALAARVQEKDGYVDNLNAQAQLLAPRVHALGLDRLALCGWTMASNLEHIGDYAVNVARQHAYRHGDELPDGTHDLDHYVGKVRRGLDLAMKALREESMDDAFAACQVEDEIDRLYAEDLQVLEEAMTRGGGEAREALTWVIVTKNLERMGDMVLNLGEAVLSLECGERLKLEHMRTIEELLPASRFEAKGVWGGISGAFIGLVERDGETHVYKGGPRDKILREYDNLKLWQTTAPGLAARVIRAPVDDETAGLLLEHIEGPTLEDVVLRRDDALEPFLSLLMDTLESLWERTQEQKPVRSDFVRQISKRLPELYELHPELARVRRVATRLGPHAFPSVSELLHEAERRELRLNAPFSVLLHGDMNLSNIIVEQQTDEQQTDEQQTDEQQTDAGQSVGQIRFVDVYRSHSGDLAQDVGVLMVSCLRHPLAVSAAADRARCFYTGLRRRAVQWAREHGDGHFDSRLRLALARAYMTSGRVLRDHDLARRLFLKGVQYLEGFLCVR